MQCIRGERMQEWDLEKLSINPGDVSLTFYSKEFIFHFLGNGTLSRFSLGF